MAAIDLNPATEPVAQALRAAVRRVLDGEPAARLSCVTMLKLARLTADEFEDPSRRNLRLLRRVQLEQWARTLHLAPERVTYHVLESPDPGVALIDYARHNGVDHLVMGARGRSTLRRYLGSVSSAVVAQAPCTVTVVRAPAIRRRCPPRREDPGQALRLLSVATSGGQFASGRPAARRHACPAPPDPRARSRRRVRYYRGVINRTGGGA